MQNHTIQQLLQAQFQLRLSTNEHYSMRAFAKDLKLSPSQLSLVLAGKRGLSRTRAQLIAESLNLTALEKEVFLNQVELTYARSHSARAAAKHNLLELDTKKHMLMSHEQAFHVFSEWHHFAILQVMKLNRYDEFCEMEGEASFLTRVLNLRAEEVLTAISRLSELSLIVKSPKGHFHQAIPGVVLSQEGVQTSAFKKYKKQLTQKAFNEMDHHDRNENSAEAILFNISTQDFPLLKEELKLFSIKMKEKYQREGEQGAHVVALTQQLHEITRISGIDS